MGEESPLVGAMERVGIPDEVKQVIAERTQAVVSLKFAWERACGLALSAGLDSKRVVQFAAVFSHPRFFEHFVVNGSREPGRFGELIEEIVRDVDEFSCSFEEWVRAYEVVQSHLFATKRDVSSQKVAGYVNCSAEFSGGSVVRRPLNEVVKEMLELYGFQG